MNILVIGGSYFLGKCFVNIARDKHHITVFNRGNAPLNIEGVTELKGDRRNREDLKCLEDLDIDVVVDFCAYAPGDIELMLEAILSKQATAQKLQYIYLSTVDIYEHGLGRVLEENAPLETCILGGAEGDYILGKIALEHELRDCVAKYASTKACRISYTSVRPTIIYGPDNYAPREDIYFYWIKNAGQILHPSDSDGEFQMVYVEDVARAVEKMCGNEEAYNQAFNLTGTEMVSYNRFAEVLEKVVELPVTRVEVPLQVILEKNIPLPFPLTKQESNWYNGNKVLSLIGGYTELEEGMRRTVEAVLKKAD